MYALRIVSELMSLSKSRVNSEKTTSPASRHIQEDFCVASCNNIQNKHNNTPSLTTISHLWIDNDGTESSLFLFKNAQKRTFLCYEVINWWLLVTVSVWLWIMAIDRSQHPDIHVSSMVTLVHKTLETIWINLPFMNI